MNQPTTTKGYLIFATASNPCYGNGYPLYVSAETLRKALLTGDYEFTEDETREIPTDIQYRDERLN